MSNFRSIMIIACIFGVIAVVSAIPVLSYAQQQTNFAATLNGKNVVPPVDTPATGIAKFHVNPNRTLSYEVDVNNINNVVGVPIKLKDGTELAELLNLYATVNQKSFTQSLGATNGQLTSGVLTGAKLDGPLFGKNVTDLIPFLANKSANVVVRTTPHQQGEIQGQILPGAAPAAAPASGTNATTSAANKTAPAPAPSQAPAPAPSQAPAPAPSQAPAPTAAPSAGMNSSAPAPAAGMNKTAPTAAPSAGMNSSAPAPAAGMNKTGGMGATSLGNMICHYIPQSKSLLCRMA
jgi:CHRD domain